MSITESNPWKINSTEIKYDSPWISVEHHEVLNPAGNPGTYSVVRFKKYAIGIIPLDEELNTWIVGQYRFPFDAYSWEIPEGGGEKEIDPIISAKRELMEECGILAGKWELIQELQTSNAATDEYAYLFIARDLTFTQSQPDENEQLQVKKLPFEELYQMVLKGEITDAMSVAAVLRANIVLSTFAEATADKC